MRFTIITLLLLHFKNSQADTYTFKDIFNFPKTNYKSQSKLFSTYCKYVNKFNDSRGKYYRKDLVSGNSCKEAARKLNRKCYEHQDSGEDPLSKFRAKLISFEEKEKEIESEDINHNKKTKKLNDEVKAFYRSKEFKNYKKFLGNGKEEFLEIENKCFVKNKKIKTVEKIMIALSLPNSGNPICESLKNEYPEFTDYISFKNGKLMKKILLNDKNRRQNTIKPSSSHKHLKYNWNISMTKKFHSISSGVNMKCFGDDRNEDNHCLLPSKGIENEKYINERESFWSNKREFVNKAIKNTEYVSALLKTPEFRRLAFACSPKNFSKHFKIKRREHIKDCENNKPYAWTPTFLATELPYQCQIILNSEYSHRYKDQKTGLYKIDELERDTNSSSSR
jgi:hypothetical protein